MDLIATLAELCERIPVLWNPQTRQFGATTGILLNTLYTSSEITRARLKAYYGENLKCIHLHYSTPIKLSMDEEYQESWGINLMKISDYTREPDIPTEAIVIEAINAVQYKVYGQFSGDLGIGNKTMNFVSDDLTFRILERDWVTGDFTAGDRWIFSRSWYEQILMHLTSLYAAHLIVQGRYMSEGSNELDFENNQFLKEYEKMIEDLIDPNNSLALTTPNAPYNLPNFEETQDWNTGYNIDNLGLNRGGF